MSTQTVIDAVIPPSAPKRTTEMVKAAVLSYIGRYSLTNWGEPDKAADDIAQAWSNGVDGYELAKKLEDDFYWDGLCLQDAEETNGR
jgi:hypothetical protein